MSPTITAFLSKWKGSAGNERANKDAFLLDLCEALNLAPPEPKDAASAYCFEKDLKITHLDGSTSTGSIDLFKASCFVLEAKQGSTKAKPGSSPLRGTRAYDQYMERAFGQAVNYAIRLPQRRSHDHADVQPAHEAAERRGLHGQGARPARRRADRDPAPAPR